jgi:NADH dehydrogenase FAD-containing subunit
MAADKPIAPAGLFQVSGAGSVVWEKALELWERLWELKISVLMNVHEHSRTLALVAVGDNRIGMVGPFLRVADAPGVFVVGDAASVVQNEHPVPGVAQAAVQEGRYVGRLIAKELKGRSVKRPFRYFDKGNMAVVGKNYAVLERGWLRTSGVLTWLVWAFVHILSLPQLQNCLRVQRQWLWSYFTGQRSSRLIPEQPQAPDADAM